MQNNSGPYLVLGSMANRRSLSSHPGQTKCEPGSGNRKDLFQNIISLKPDPGFPLRCIRDDENRVGQQSENPGPYPGLFEGRGLKV